MLHNFREGELTKQHDTHGASRLPANWSDPHDAAVYASARALFTKRAREYATPCDEAAPTECQRVLAEFLQEEDESHLQYYAKKN